MTRLFKASLWLLKGDLTGSVLSLLTFLNSLS